MPYDVELSVSRGVGDREVRGIAVDVQYHVGGVISDCGVRVSC
jgi:hypothetical protein